VESGLFRRRGDKEHGFKKIDGYVAGKWIVQILSFSSVS
jgi:hypothetical protein